MLQSAVLSQEQNDRKLRRGLILSSFIFRGVSKPLCFSFQLILLFVDVALAVESV